MMMVICNLKVFVLLTVETSDNN